MSPQALKPHDFIAHRYTGVLVFGGESINPNGNPDMGGDPRQCPTTGYGLVTSVSTTRRLRDFAEFAHGQKIHIRKGSTIEAGILEAAASIPAPTAEAADGKRKRAKNAEDTAALTAAANKMFWDDRMLGNVLNVGKSKTDNVTGVVCVTMGHSVYPIDIVTHTITRVNAANDEQEKDQEMGRRSFVRFGIYTQPFFVDPRLAAKNGATMEDLAIAIDGFVNLWESRRSSMSGNISLRGLWLFEHDNPLGCAPAHSLLDRVKIYCADPGRASKWSDYDIHFDDANMEKGIKVHTLEQLIGGKKQILAQLGVG